MPIQSLGSASSGIVAMQTDLNTIGNDIANSETTGFASESAQFSDLLTQQIQPATAAVGQTLASTNPSAIGTGVGVQSIDTNFSQGSVTQTGINSNVAIVGNGFLVVKQGANTYYTRDGNLQIDSQGNLATNGGGLVQGWGPGQAVTSPTGPISIILGSRGAPQQTQNVNLSGNLPSNPSGPVTITTTMHDSLGNQVPVTLTLTPTLNSSGAATSWSMQGTATGSTTNLWSSAQTLTFSSSGQLATVNGTAVTTSATAIPINNEPTGYTWSGTTMPTFTFPAVGSQQAVTQYAGSESLIATADGNASGTLQSYSIGGNGAITGTYSNGHTVTLGTIALAQFANPNGLNNVGGTNFSATVASGTAQVGQPASGGLGTLQDGALEGSNVNMAKELTDLIEAQTAYQANTKVIMTTQSALSSLMQIP
ncbi:MAG: flagellar hook protein FlgE [Actinobacteria bacterium]|nr:flagellar hook protein FlgE [Actinomycetota bacterium]